MKNQANVPEGKCIDSKDLSQDFDNCLSKDLICMLDDCNLEDPKIENSTKIMNSAGSLRRPIKKWNLGQFECNKEKWLIDYLGLILPRICNIQDLIQ
jgi:hypothetical protein